MPRQCLDMGSSADYASTRCQRAAEGERVLWTRTYRRSISMASSPANERRGGLLVLGRVQRERLRGPRRGRGRGDARRCAPTRRHRQANRHHGGCAHRHPSHGRRRRVSPLPKSSHHGPAGRDPVALAAPCFRSTRGAGGDACRVSDCADRRSVGGDPADRTGGAVTAFAETSFRSRRSEGRGRAVRARPGRTDGIRAAPTTRGRGRSAR
jgi:hypothetical protein